MHSTLVAIKIQDRNIVRLVQRPRLAHRDTSRLHLRNLRRVEPPRFAALVSLLLHDLAMAP